MIKTKKLTSIRLTEENIGDIQKIRDRTGLPSDIDAIRFALRSTINGLHSIKPRKKVWRYCGCLECQAFIKHQEEMMKNE